MNRGNEAKPFNLRNELKPLEVMAIVVSREQTPLYLAPMSTVVGTLSTGDYSLQGLGKVIAIERKNLADLITCIGRGPERFEREVQSLLASPVRALVIEAAWEQIELGQWQGRVSCKAALHSLLVWITRGLPTIMCHAQNRCGEYSIRSPFIAAK